MNQPFACPVCGRPFKVLGHPYNAHLRTHVTQGVLRETSKGGKPVFHWRDTVVRARRVAEGRQ